MIIYDATMETMGEHITWVGYTVLLALFYIIILVLFHSRYMGIRTIMLTDSIYVQQVGLIAVFYFVAIRRQYVGNHCLFQWF